MCGIAGYLQLDSKRPLALTSMLGQLRRRGPDECGEHRWTYAALGAARLSMVGAAAGRQPQLDRSLQSGLVLNGEIYNWRELAIPGERSDTAVAKRLIDADGADALEQLSGGFSLAYWDESNQTLSLARDEYGQKPLYFWETRERVVFASSIRALIAAGYEPSVEHEGLSDLAQLQFLAPGRTLFAGVSQVQPGTCLQWTRRGGALHKRPLRFRFRMPDDGTAAGPEELRGLLTRAIRRQDSGEHRAALFLSGGLDSSVLAAGFAQQNDLETAAFGIVGAFEGDGVPDERVFARLAAEHAGLPLDELVISPGAWLEALPRVVEALEMPFAGPGSVAQFLLCEHAAARGARIVYGGQGGDELFGGYERVRILQSLVQDAQASADSSYAPLLQTMREAFAEGGVQAAYASALDRGRSLRGVTRGSLAGGMLSGASGLDLRRFGTWTNDTLADVERFEIEVLLPGLLGVDDRCSSYFSLESRLPFLDPAFASVVRQVKLEDKSPTNQPRKLFRKAFGPWLPQSIQDRQDKCGFAVPLADWFDGSLKSWATGILRDPASLRRGWWTDEEAHAMLSDPGRHGRMIFHCLSLEYWHRAFVYGADQVAVEISAEAERAKAMESQS